MALQWDIRRYSAVGSTNDEARALAQAGAPEGTVVVAEGQTAGRGREERGWFSPEGKGLYCSILLRPQVAPAALPSLTLTAGLAVCDALESFVPIPPQIKWPNDILIGGARGSGFASPSRARSRGSGGAAPAADDIWLAGRKVCGILSESVANAGGSLAAIIGIGINVNLRQDEFPRELQETAISLAVARGQPLDRELVLQALLRTFDARYVQWSSHGWPALKPDYCARSCLEGRRVRVTFGSDRRKGIVRGVDDTGALLLETDAGKTEDIVAGDVVILTSPAATSRRVS